MQVPAPFGYERASSVKHAIALLERHGPEARALAGGHSLLPMMKLRLARPEVLVDLDELAGELGYVRVDGEELAIGAMTRHAQVLDSAVLAEHYPIFADAERVIADPLVRNRGTVGGSLCQADPAEDLSAVLSALGAVAVVRSSSATRRIPVRELHVGPYETALQPAELLLEVRVPIRPGAGSAYAKLERRAGDWAIAAAGAWLTLDGSTVSDVGLGLAAVGADRSTCESAEQGLRGGPATGGQFAAAGSLIAERCSPTADQRGPVDYKRHLAGVLTERALRAAAARARGEGS